MIVVNDDPFSLGINISSIYSTDEIIDISYQLEDITNWIKINYKYDSINDKTNIYQIFDKIWYYDIINKRNNTVYVKISNNQNITLIKSLNFNINPIITVD